MKRSPDTPYLSLQFLFFRQPVFFHEVVDNILRNISRVFPGSFHTFIDIPESNGIGSFLPEYTRIDFLAQGLENTHRFNIVVRLFHIIIKKRNDTTVKYSYGNL